MIGAAGAGAACGRGRDSGTRHRVVSAAVSRQTIDEIVSVLEATRAAEAPAKPYVRVPSARYTAMTHDVLRQAHAHDTVERPDASASYEQDVGTLSLWARRGPDGGSWVALATSVTRIEQGIVVDAGFRVPADSPEHAAELAQDPARALAVLLTRFGLSYWSQGKRVYVTPLHVVSLGAPLEELGPDQFARAVGLETPPDGTEVAVNVKVARSRDGLSRLAWLFVIDLTRYAAEARPRRR